MKYKKSVAILVFNDKKELALQLRAAHDDKYPLHWDFSAAGGIESGEDYADAARRELKEELGIESEIEFIRMETYQDENSIEDIYIYKTLYNGRFNPNPNEVQESRFFSLDAIENMMVTGEKFHPEFRFVWNKGLIKSDQK
ncbi:MAG TPA: NUDIX domain-containing protein [Candidatus Nitrosocosmicus sp.]|nr:NUDIX domain-containing protein [Candidatus Nitrosocosmicus sp.]